MSNISQDAQKVLSAAHTMWSCDELVAATLTLREELENNQLSNSEKFAIRKALAELYITTHQLGSAKTVLHIATALCENMPEGERTTSSAHVAYLKARIDFMYKEYDAAFEKLNDAVNGFRSVCHKNALFNALLLKAKVLVALENHKDAIAVCREARILPVSESCIFELNAVQALASTYALDMDTAERCATRIFETLARSIGTASFEAVITTLTVADMLNAGDMDKTIQHLRNICSTVEAPHHAAI